jgi:protein ImuA
MPDPLLEHIPNVWRAESLAATRGQLVPSGFAELDAALGGGWPRPALIELLTDKEGIGELQLLLPLIQAASVITPNNDRSIVLWLNPPHAIHAVALMQYGLEPTQHWTSAPLSDRDTMWAMEQALRSGACALVIAWANRSTVAMLRRLKLASSAGNSLGVLFRPTRASRNPSPATVRAELHAHASYMHVALLKVQGRKQTSVMLDVQRRITREQTEARHE